MSELDQLLQLQLRDYIENRLGKEVWINVYDRGHFCALIPERQVAGALDRAGWDLSIGDGKPGCSIRYQDGEDIVEYSRFNTYGIEPLVIVRDFHGMRPSYVELLEEFRLFHNLYHDPRDGTYIKIDDDGEEDVVVRYTDRSVEMKLVPIRQFLAMKDMFLAIFFDSVVDSQKFSPEDIDADKRHVTVKSAELVYDFVVAEGIMSNRPSFSRLVGKKMIPPLPKEKSGIWPFSEQEEAEYADFIIGTTEAGGVVTYPSNPDNLANYFGANPDAPHYLTPIYFKRDVLGKYYSNPDKYHIRDGYLGCGGLWGLRLDNNHDKYVIVFLGDLGRDLPYAEQLYWKSFNVAPEGGISAVNYERSIRGRPADPSQPDLYFKYRFELFRERWREQFGWDLFMPLSEGDEHFYLALRVPLNDSQAEFDSQVLALTKVLVDSLNEKELKRYIGAVDANTKGISKFELFLRDKGFPHVDSAISLLRDIQGLRSTGVAHRKGSTYKKVAEAFDTKGRRLAEIFSEMLKHSALVLEHLETHFIPTSGVGASSPEESA